MGEGAAIYNCILCDSYALITLGVLPDRKLARGIKGKAAYEDLLESFQESHASPARCHLLACPTCNAYARQDDAAPPGEIVLPDQMEQGRFAREGLAVLTPCFLVAFEEGELPPIYADDAVPGAKPKWRLVQGVGPPGLEVDRTRTGRLHKPSLRPFGVDVRPLKLPPEIAGGSALADAVREACAFAEANVGEEVADRGADGGADGVADGSAAMRTWREMTCEGRPVLERWAEARAAATEDEEARARMEEARGGDEARLGRYEQMRMELGRAAKEASKVDYASMFNPR